MNLEKILETQIIINDNINNLLNHNNDLLYIINGVSESKELKTPECTDNKKNEGLINDISYAQEKTQILIEKLINNESILRKCIVNEESYSDKSNL